MQQENQVQLIDKFFTIVFVVTCFAIILIYIHFISIYSISQFISYFITAPVILVTHKGRAVLDWYLYLFADISLVLAGCSLIITRVDRLRLISESLAVFFLLIIGLITAGTVTFQDPYLYIVLTVIVLYAISLGYREQASKGFIRLLKLGLTELGFSLKLLLSTGILVLLTLSGIGFIHWNLPFWSFNPLFIFYAVFAAPILEELFFRVYLLNRINESIKNSGYSVIASSVCFAFYHNDFLLGFPHHIDPSLFWGRFVIGLILGGIYLSLIPDESIESEQKQLWKAMCGHGIWNFFVIFIHDPFIKPLLPFS